MIPARTAQLSLESPRRQACEAGRAGGPGGAEVGGQRQGARHIPVGGGVRQREDQAGETELAFERIDRLPDAIKSIKRSSVSM